MDPKQTLHWYLRKERDALLAKLDGLDERSVRWPMTSTGTNLLGLVKHTASMEVGYFGEVFGRPTDVALPWLAEDAEANADMWATAEESREEIVEPVPGRSGTHRRHDQGARPRFAGLCGMVAPGAPRRHAASDPGAHVRRDGPACRARRHHPGAD
jgi:hypothetical protein